jgi:hypothetical protein
MGKYKQWLHHQEVGARLRDEIAAHEAERERVLKLAPPKETPLPDLANPIIAALLGQLSLAKAPEPSTARAGRNGAAAPAPTPVAAAAQAAPIQATDTPTEATPKSTDKPTPQITRAEAPVQKESAPAKAAAPAEAPARPKPAAAAPTKTSAEKQPPPPVPAETPRVSAPIAASAPAQPDTIDPLLEQLLAHAESAPADPLEALNLLASQGPNLTRGEAPPITTLPTAPLQEPASIGQSALNTLLSESKATPEPAKRASEAASGSVAVGVEAIATAEAATRAETSGRLEKKRSDTDELVASRPTEGYTEPRLIVPQWLKSMELTQGQESEQAEQQPEEADEKQRFSVSLPFESEEDMRLHESVERWWQRWRQQS